MKLLIYLLILLLLPIIPVWSSDSLDTIRVADVLVYRDSTVSVCDTVWNWQMDGTVVNGCDEYQYHKTLWEVTTTCRDSTVVRLK